MPVPNTRDHLLPTGLRQIHSTGYAATDVIEASYPERLAKRGYNLILLARSCRF